MGGLLFTGTTSWQQDTLPTFLSGIAALGVVLQWYAKPHVYATLDPRLSTKPYVLLLEPGTTTELHVHVYNCSNLTADDIVVQGQFPQQIRIESLAAPVWSWIDRATNRFEVHFNSDWSYNPIHPHIHVDLKFSVSVGQLPGPHAVVLTTMATPGSGARRLIRKARLPLADDPERLTAPLMIATVLQAILAGPPWVTSLVATLLNAPH